jgi:uncharacterized membrane protein (UPF0182 family)
VLLLAAVGLIALLLVGRRLVDAYVNWLWFGEVGFRSVWVTVLLTRVAIFVTVALVVGGTVFLALMLAYRSRPVFVPAARPTTRARRTGPSRCAGRGCSGGASRSVSVCCGLIAQSGCSAVRALSAPNSYAPDSQGRFSLVVDHPPKSNSDRKLIEATMCPSI